MSRPGTKAPWVDSNSQPRDSSKSPFSTSKPELSTASNDVAVWKLDGTYGRTLEVKAAVPLPSERDRSISTGPSLLRHRPSRSLLYPMRSVDQITSALTRASAKRLPEDSLP